MNTRKETLRIPESSTKKQAGLNCENNLERNEVFKRQLNRSHTLLE